MLLRCRTNQQIDKYDVNVDLYPYDVNECDVNVAVKIWCKC